MLYTLAFVLQHLPVKRSDNYLLGVMYSFITISRTTCESAMLPMCMSYATSLDIHFAKLHPVDSNQ